MKFISKNGSHAPKAKSAALIIAIVLILVAAVGGTVAFIATHTEPVTNQFTPTEAKITVNEKFDGKTKEIITVKNDSTGFPVYIRVALVANQIADDSNTVTGKAPDPNITLGDGWIEGSDGYYYYTKPVAVGDSTDNLLGASLTLANGTQVIVMADCIQATPVDAVKDAWHVTVGDDGIITGK